MKIKFIKAVIWTFEKKVDLARKFECYSSQVPPSSSLLPAALPSNPLPTEEPAVHEQACNHSNRGRQISKTAH